MLNKEEILDSLFPHNKKMILEVLDILNPNLEYDYVHTLNSSALAQILQEIKMNDNIINCHEAALIGSVDLFPQVNVQGDLVCFLLKYCVEENNEFIDRNVIYIYEKDVRLFN